MTATVFKHNEEGPQFSTMENDAKLQQTFFAELQAFSLEDECTRTADYFKVANINGIDFYHPNDEDWGAIIAVDTTNKVAIYTGFHEMDDMASVGSCYAQVFHNGYLCCKFETE